ncbi:hypothetical protein STCU_08973 [Strigomonas culicis]|nr:hypothetical protein STCU_08973 [Strigomonas culicis]|eukprot:EPY20497.1 hypothetical protein STCU_08973 [Strigomonas culicis]
MFVIQFLSAVYPKSRDRRCYYQQLSCCGTDYQSTVPLTTKVPPSELHLCTARTPHKSLEYTEVVEFIRNSYQMQLNRIQNTEEFSVIFSKFISIVLPRVVIAKECDFNEASEKIQILIDAENNKIHSWSFFLHVVWKLLVLSEGAGTRQSELVDYLTKSTWSGQSFITGGNKIIYRQFFSLFAESCLFCLSCDSYAAPSADNMPLINPRIIHFLASVDAEPCEISEEVPEALQSFPIAQPSRLVMESTTKELKEKLSETIPQEISFNGSSSTCRDCDQLTLICRDLINAPIGVDNSEGIDASFLKKLLFSRKRSRGGTLLNHGPALAPVKSSLTDFFDETSSLEKNTLECILEE